MGWETSRAGGIAWLRDGQEMLGLEGKLASKWLHCRALSWGEGGGPSSARPAIQKGVKHLYLKQ